MYLVKLYKKWPVAKKLWTDRQKDRQTHNWIYLPKLNFLWQITNRQTDEKLLRERKHAKIGTIWYLNLVELISKIYHGIKGREGLNIVMHLFQDVNYALLFVVRDFGHFEVSNGAIWWHLSIAGKGIARINFANFFMEQIYASAPNGLQTWL